MLLMTASALGDRLGRRRVFAAGLGLFAAASAACALSPNAGTLIVARAVQGVGAATIMPLALAVLNTAFPPERRGWAMGIYGGVTGLAALLGPVVGGAITQGISWPWIFWVKVPIAVLAIPLVIARVPESFGPAAGLDFRGLALGAVAALGLVWGLVRGNAAGWGSAEALIALIGGTGLGLAFVLGELRARSPRLPMRLVRSRAFSAGNATIFFLNAPLTGGADVSYAEVAPMTVAGVGFSMALPAVTKAVFGGVAMADIGKASGAFTTMRQLGGAFGVAILVAVFAAAGSYGSAQAFSNGFVPAIGAAAGVAFAGAVAGWLLPRGARDGEPGPAALSRVRAVRR